jgi:hypothetical protein
VRIQGEIRREVDAIRCQRHARTSALTSVPSGWDLVAGTIACRRGDAIRLQPPRRWSRTGMRMANVLPLDLNVDARIEPDQLTPVFSARR